MGRREQGQQGEEYTAHQMELAGWTILMRNYHSRWGEIDLITSNDVYLAFVEVKTRVQSAWGEPATAVDANKQRRIICTAQQYLLCHPSDLQPRFDVAEVVTRSSQEFEVVRFSILTNAFDTSSGD